MKNILISSFILMCLLFISNFAFGNNFLVTGNVTDDNGDPVPDQEIILRTENFPGDSALMFSTFTDETGVYFIEFSSDEDILLITVETYVYACNEYYVEHFQAEAGILNQIDFTVCSEQIYTGCDLFFFWYTEPVNPYLVYFNPITLDSTEYTSYNWDFGDGTGSELKYPQHEYADAGEYFVTLSAYNDQCGAMYFEDFVFINNDTINYECFADFWFMIDSVNQNTVYFEDMSWAEFGISSWTWDFGDGTTGSEQNPVHTYTEEGEYEVTLTIESGDICSSTMTQIIWVGESSWYPEECQALFYAEYDFEDYKTVQFIDLSWGGMDSVGGNEILAWNWDFGDGGLSSEQNPIHRYSEDGEYLVNLTIYTENCSNTFQEMIFIEDWTNPWGDCVAFFYPEFDSTATAVQFYDLSIPEPQYWNWEFGDGEFSTEQNPYHVFPGTGIYLVSLEAGSDSCSNMFMMEIELFEQNKKSKDVSYWGIIRRAYMVPGSGGLTATSDPTVSNIDFWPNPVKDRLNIQLPGHVSEATVSIYDISGKLINVEYVTNMNRVQMNTSYLPAGVYLTKIVFNGKTEVLKFIK